MNRIPRHRQQPISFRSDLARELLTKLSGNGLSQAEIIEDALTKAVEATPKLSREEFIAKIDAIVRPAHGLPGKTYHEIREEMYDENGLPR